MNRDADGLKNMAVPAEAKVSGVPRSTGYYVRREWTKVCNVLEQTRLKKVLHNRGAVSRRGNKTRVMRPRVPLAAMLKGTNLPEVVSAVNTHGRAAFTLAGTVIMYYI